MIGYIKIFKASEDSNASARYIDGHRKVLEAYGVTKVTSANTDWQYDPNTFVIIVESEDCSKVYGGGRIQIRSKDIKMPMEDAIAILDRRIYPYVEKIGDNNVAEFCGLWNSKEVAGYGIGSIFIGRVAVAITTMINIKHLMGLCSPATLRNSARVGFEIIRELGNDGKLYYPKEDLIATALILNDIHNLPTAVETERNAIQEIRMQKKGVIQEVGPRGAFELHYNISSLEEAQG